MSRDPAVDRAMALDFVNRIESILMDAEAESQPLELDPARGALFEVFAQADAAGFVEDEADPDLTADGLCRALAERWGLGDATRASVEQQTKLPPEHLARMRLLWSLMRMWMEWDYAWRRYGEFHRR